MALLKSIARFPPVFTAFLSQVFAYLVGLLVMQFLKLPLTVLQFAFISSTLAAWLGYQAGLAIWWLPIQLLFVPALLMAMAWTLPSWMYLAAFLMMLAIYWSAFKTQVPLYLSSERVWEALETLLPKSLSNGKFTFIDLGCGVGGVLTHLGRERPEGTFEGVEYAPLPFFISWLRIRLSRLTNCRTRWGSLWEIDFSRYDVVYAYLSPVPMGDLWQKVHREMKPGSVFISNTFEVPGVAPTDQLQVNDLHRSTLYIWRF